MYNVDVIITSTAYNKNITKDIMKHFSAHNERDKYNER